MNTYEEIILIPCSEAMHQIRRESYRSFIATIHNYYSTEGVRNHLQRLYPAHNATVFRKTKYYDVSHHIMKIRKSECVPSSISQNTFLRFRGFSTLN